MSPLCSPSAGDMAIFHSLRIDRAQSGPIGATNNDCVSATTNGTDSESGAPS